MHLLVYTIHVSMRLNDKIFSRVGVLYNLNLHFKLNVFINSDHKRIQECSMSVKGSVICNQRCLESDQPGV